MESFNLTLIVLYFIVIFIITKNKNIDKLIGNLIPTKQIYGARQF